MPSPGGGGGSLLLEQARYFVHPPRRAGRSFPREVKRSRSKFPTKKMPVRA